MTNFPSENVSNLSSNKAELLPDVGAVHPHSRGNPYFLHSERQDSNLRPLTPQISAKHISIDIAGYFGANRSRTFLPSSCQTLPNSRQAIPAGAA